MSAPLRLLSSRPHLSVAIAIGVAVALCLPPSMASLRRALIAWDGAVWFYLLSMAWMMLRADHHTVRRLARRQDENAGLVLASLVLAAAASLAAIISELSGAAPAVRLSHFGFTALTVLGSWFLVGTLFCIHYAHLYYLANSPPLQFPEQDETPDYWDFLYFSFTIAVAAQTADVCIKASGLRRLVLGQAVLSFFFNLLILGLSVNIAAALING